MKREIVHSMVWLVMASMFLAIPATTLAERSPKRGVSQNGFTYAEEITALTPGVCWYYNWAGVPSEIDMPVVGPGTDMEFCPMAWGSTFNEEELRSYLTEHPGVKYLLGFNEPNFKNQANMTPAQAVEVWPRLEAIAEEFGLGLVGPAVNYSPDAPYTDPTTWYDEFFELYPDARVDYIALHCYMVAADGMMNYINSIAERYGKKIWLTEFCAWDGLTTNAESARKIQRDEMVRKVEALELSEHVFRYSWFKAKGADNYPYYALLKYKNESQGIPAGTLTDLGTVYLYMSVFDTTRYYAPDVEFAASDYVKSNLISVNVSDDAASSFPLKVEGFSNMRTIDYLIDVPEAGPYRVEMRVSTSGLPVTAYIDGEEAGKAEWSATGEQGVWSVRYIDVTMPAGKHRLQLKGTKLAQYCDMSVVKFYSIAGINVPVEETQVLQYSRRGDMIYLTGSVELSRCEVYDFGGKLVRSVICGDGNAIDMKALPKGFYIVRAFDVEGTPYSCKICM